MERISHIFCIIKRVIRTRLFAALALAMVTVMMTASVSVSAHAVTVSDGQERRVVLTMYSDPYKAIEMAGMTMENYDLIRINPTAAKIDIDRAITVEVTADGTSTVVYMNGGTVRNALEKAEVTLGKYDTVSVDLDAPLTAGMAVAVNRVKYEDYTRTENIAYETQVKYTPVLKPGRTKVTQQGRNGVKTTTYRNTIVDGRVVETNAVNEQVTKQAVTQKVIKGSAYGTPLSKAPFSIALDGKNQPVNYKNVYTNKSCTAYSIGTRGASGMRLGVGTIAVNPKVIPYGTKLWITSADGKFVYGYAVAADTGSFAQGTRTFADLYFGSYTEACYFGRRNLNIYVIG